MQENTLCSNGTNLLGSCQCEFRHLVRLYFYICFGKIQHVLVNIHKVIVLFFRIDTLIGKRIAALGTGDIDTSFLQNLTFYGIGSVFSGTNTAAR